MEENSGFFKNFLANFSYTQKNLIVSMNTVSRMLRIKQVDSIVDLHDDIM